MSGISSKMILTLTEQSQARYMYFIHNSNYKTMDKTDFGIVDCCNNTYTIAGFFEDMEQLLELPEFRRTDRLISIANLCRNCIKLKSVGDFFDTSKIQFFMSSFENCEELEELPELDFSSAISYANMLSGCKKLKKVIIKNAPKSFNKAYLNAPETCEIILK